MNVLGSPSPGGTIHANLHNRLSLRDLGSVDATYPALPCWAKLGTSCGTCSVQRQAWSSCGTGFSSRRFSSKLKAVMARRLLFCFVLLLSALRDFHASEQSI